MVPVTDPKFAPLFGQVPETTALPEVQVIPFTASVVGIIVVLPVPVNCGSSSRFDAAVPPPGAVPVALGRDWSARLVTICPVLVKLDLQLLPAAVAEAEQDFPWRT